MPAIAPCCAAYDCEEREGRREGGVKYTEIAMVVNYLLTTVLLLLILLLLLLAVAAVVGVSYVRVGVRTHSCS